VLLTDFKAADSTFRKELTKSEEQPEQQIRFLYNQYGYYSALSPTRLIKIKTALQEVFQGIFQAEQDSLRRGRTRGWLVRRELHVAKLVQTRTAPWAPAAKANVEKRTTGVEVAGRSKKFRVPKKKRTNCEQWRALVRLIEGSIVYLLKRLHLGTSPPHLYLLLFYQRHKFSQQWPILHLLLL